MTEYILASGLCLHTCPRRGFPHKQAGKQAYIANLCWRSYINYMDWVSTYKVLRVGLAAFHRDSLWTVDLSRSPARKRRKRLTTYLDVIRSYVGDREGSTVSKLGLLEKKSVRKKAKPPPPPPGDGRSS